jgi:hypothetical protein
MKQISLLMLMPFIWAFQPATAPPATIQRLSSQSNFVFQGTVSRLNATTEPQIPASPTTAVVLVESVIDGNNMVSDVVGREITVQLLRAGSVAPGRRVLFFSNLAVASKSVAVKEVAHFDVARSNTMATQVTDYQRRKPEIDLQARVTGADLIVTGRVASIARPEQQRTGPPPSEHDPEWTDAIVDVQSTEKGAAVQRVTVSFPASTDIRWFRSPKLQVGQTAVFLLRRGRDRGAPALTALDPLDVRPLADRDHLRQLVQRVR